MARFTTRLIYTTSVIGILLICASAVSPPQGSFGRPAVISASPSELDLFVIAEDGNGYLSSMGSGRSSSIPDDQFSEWRALPTLAMPSRANLTGVVDGAGNDHLFVVASNGTIHTLSYQHPDIGGWRAIEGLETRPGSTIAAILFEGRIEIFAIGPSNRIYTTSLPTGNNSVTSFDWSRVGEIQTPNIAPTAAALTGDGRLHIFVTGVDRSTYTASRTNSSEVWSDWEAIAEGLAVPGAAISAVSRSVGQLDVFVVGLDNMVWTAAKHPGDTAWRGWWQMPGFNAFPGIEIGAISRQTNTLDVFCPDADDLKIYRNWWPYTGGGWFGDWKHANTGLAATGTSIVLVSKAPGTVDAFVTGHDGTVWQATSTSIEDGFCGWWVIGTEPVPRTCDSTEGDSPTGTAVRLDATGTAVRPDATGGAGHPQDSQPNSGSMPRVIGGWVVPKLAVCVLGYLIL
ncbi:hypothetical protein DL771_006028 [Monosporascus sp. 5C6A]|nr:hypothetical protein DL771_006028 [Monosporascus sp. 5C6A]